MRSPLSLRNGEARPPGQAVVAPPYFQSTVSLQKLRRFNKLLLLLRFAAFSFSLAAAVFMATDLKSGPAKWTRLDAFRYVVAACGIVAVYSFFEMGFGVWEVVRGTTPFPEAFQLWFDFGHDQGFAYLLLAASVAGTVEVRNQWAGERCLGGSDGFCVQATIAVALSFAGFLIIGCSALLSAFRLACYSITGHRFHL